MSPSTAYMAKKNKQHIKRQLLGHVEIRDGTPVFVLDKPPEPKRIIWLPYKMA